MIDFIYRMLAKIGITKHQDKVLHGIAAVAIAVIVSKMVPEIKDGTPIAYHDYVDMLPEFAIVVAAIGKERYDKLIKKTKSDFFDMFATIAGGFVGIVLAGMVI